MSNNGPNPKSVPSGLELRGDTAIQGLMTALPVGVTTMTVGTITYPIPDLITHARTLVKPWKDIRGAHEIIRQVMADRPEDSKALQEFLADLNIGVAVVVGRDNEVLAKFGFKPKRAASPLTSEERALKAAKLRLTRAQRHTMGTRQRDALGTAETPEITIAPDGKVSVEPAQPAQPAATQPNAATKTA